MTGTTRQRNTRNLPRGYFADAQDHFASPSTDNAVQGTGVPGAAADTDCAIAAPAGDTLGRNPTGEARSVNVGTARKPCWVIEGPAPTEADRQWTRDIVDALHPISCDTAGDACSERNLGPTPAGESDAGALSPDGLDTTGALGVTACGGPSSPQDCPEIDQQLRAARIISGRAQS